MTKPSIIIYSNVDPILGVRTAGLFNKDRPEVTGIRKGAIYVWENGDVLYAYRTKAGAVVVRSNQEGV